jgi:hypothetical protein
MLQENDESQIRQSGRELWQWLRRLKPTQNDIRIGIWGTRGAGKTTYLAALYDALSRSELWTVEAIGQEAKEFVDKHLSKMEEGDFPERTLPRRGSKENFKVFSYLIKPDQQQNSPNSSKSVTLNFVDAPGEFYEKSLTKGREMLVSDQAGNSIDIIDYLLRCDGILFLLDPVVLDPVYADERRESYSSLLRRLFMEFQDRARTLDPSLEEGRLEHYVAFGVTKVDRKEIWGDPMRLESHALAKSILGNRAFDRLKNFFWKEQNVDKRKEEKENRQPRSKKNRCDFFSIAAIGRYWDEEKGEWLPAVIDPTQEEPESSPSGVDSTDSVSSSDSPVDEGVYGGYEPEDPAHDNPPNGVKSNSTGSSASSTPFPSPPQPSSEEWGGNDESTAPAQSQGNVERINVDVDFESMGVIEPIEWLIQGIQNCPPRRLPQHEV